MLLRLMKADEWSCRGRDGFVMQFYILADSPLTDSSASGVAKRLSTGPGWTASIID